MDSVSTYKAAVSKDGTPAIIDVQTRELKEGEVFIKIIASPINPSDRYCVSGFYGITEKQNNPEEGRGIGFEAAGTVVDAHESAKGLIGKRVAFSQDVHSPEYTGVWRQYTYHSAEKVVPYPDDVDFDVICANFVNPLTACGFVDIAKKEGHKAIVHSAACSSLGKMLVKLCKAHDVPLINIVRRQEQVEMLEKIGATNIVNSSLDTYEEDLKKLTHELEATVFFDAIGGGDATNKAINAMPARSTTHIYGALGGENFSANPGSMIFQEKTIGFFWLGPWMRSLTADETKTWVGTVIGDLQQPAEKSIFRSTVVKTYPLAQIDDALKAAVEVASEGKVLIKPHDE